MPETASESTSRMPVHDALVAAMIEPLWWLVSTRFLSAMIAVAESLRASTYTIHVDLPDEPERVMLVHGYTGAYDLVSPQVAAFVRSLDPHPPKPLHGEWSDTRVETGSVVAPPEAVIEKLCRRGYVTAATRENERAQYERVVPHVDRQAQHGVPQYVMMPTYNCNLRCSYCFQDHMRTDARFEPLLRTITPAVVDRLFEAMPQIEARHSFAPEDEFTPRICLFGGEPLLARSRPAVRYILEKAHANRRRCSRAQLVARAYALRILTPPE